MRVGYRLQVDIEGVEFRRQERPLWCSLWYGFLDQIGRKTSKTARKDVEKGGRDEVIAFYGQQIGHQRHQGCEECSSKSSLVPPLHEPQPTAIDNRQRFQVNK